MNVLIDKSLSKAQRDKLLKKVEPKMKTLDAKKFAGKVSWKGDPLEIQRKMRDE